MRDVRGPFNIAADPVLDATTLAEALETRIVEVNKSVVRAGVAAAWHLHATPADPKLLDLVAELPLLDISRARDELGWTPTVSATDALREMLFGMAAGAGAPTAPLAPDTIVGRGREIASGVGELA